jgi:hypothetical protein
LRIAWLWITSEGINRGRWLILRVEGILRVVPSGIATRATTTTATATNTTANAREVNRGHLRYVSIKIAIIWKIPVAWVEAGVSRHCGVGW